MTKNDNTAAATQGDVRYLAKLVTDNKMVIDENQSAIGTIHQRFDRLEEQIDERFYAIQRMFQSMTQHVTKVDERSQSHEQRIRSLEVAS